MENTISFSILIDHAVLYLVRQNLDGFITYSLLYFDCVNYVVFILKKKVTFQKGIGNSFYLTNTMMQWWSGMADHVDLETVWFNL